MAEKGKSDYVQPKKQGFGTFLYDKKSGLVMGRSCKDWGLLTLFYLIFYACLFGFWIACLMGFLSTTNLSLPTQLGFQSMLKLNPAIGYRPQPDPEMNLIKFNASIAQSYAPYVEDMRKFLQTYENQAASNLLDCTDGASSADKDKACRYNPQEVATACFNETNADNQYTFGYASAQPCVILKMNRIIGWLPFQNSNGSYADVKLRCKGQNEADEETLGEIEYYPGGTDENGNYGLIPSYYFPYMNQRGYVSPLVFAHFKNVRPYTLALIWCQFDKDSMNFIDNIYWVSPALNERAGGAHFELVVDKAPQ